MSTVSDELLNAIQIETFTEEDREQLAAVLTNPAFRKACRIAVAELKLNPKFYSINLEDPIARSEATKVQGQVAGAYHLVSRLDTLAEKSEVAE